MKLLGLFFQDQRGVTSIEYALIAMLIALAIVVSASTLGVQLDAAYTAIANAFPDLG